MSSEQVREGLDLQAVKTTLKKCFDVFFVFAFYLFAEQMRCFVKYDTASCSIILTVAI